MQAEIFAIVCGRNNAPLSLWTDEVMAFAERDRLNAAIVFPWEAEHRIFAWDLNSWDGCDLYRRREAWWGGIPGNPGWETIKRYGGYISPAEHIRPPPKGVTPR